MQRKAATTSTTSSTVRVVLFDAVGTVLRPRTAVPVSYLELAKEYGTRRTLEEVTARFPAALQRYEPLGVRAMHNGRPGPAVRHPVRTNAARERERWRRIVTYVFDDLPRDAAGQLFQRLWDFYASSENWIVFPDVADTWQRLHERGLQLGLASNFDDRLLSLCRQHKPLNHADHCFFSSDLGFPKPHRGFYREIERRLRRRPHEIALVGDNEHHDCRMPRSLGWRCLHLDRDGQGGSTALRTLHELDEHVLATVIG